MKDNKLLEYHKKKNYNSKKFETEKHYYLNSILSDFELQITLETYRNTNGIRWK